MEVFFKNPGLCHIGTLIMKNLCLMDEDSAEVLERLVNNNHITSIDYLIFKLCKVAQGKKRVCQISKGQWIRLIKSVDSIEIYDKILGMIKQLRDHEPLLEIERYIYRVPTFLLPPLHLASQIGDEIIAKHIINEIENPFIKDGIGNLPLHWAVFEGHINIVQLLIPFTPDINTRNTLGFNGQTAFDMAILSSDKTMISILFPHVASKLIEITENKEDTERVFELVEELLKTNSKMYMIPKEIRRRQKVDLMVEIINGLITVTLKFSGCMRQWYIPIKSDRCLGTYMFEICKEKCICIN